MNVQHDLCPDERASTLGRQPRSELFIVCSEGRDTDSLAPMHGYPIENRGLAIKLTKRMRF